MRDANLDPTSDPAAADVITAFEEADRAGLPAWECYRAGVEEWRRAHPDHAPEYASTQAVEVILKNRVSLRIEA